MSDQYMTSGWDFVQALSVLRLPPRSHVKPIETKSTLPCWAGGGSASMWSFDSIHSALHTDVGELVESRDNGDLDSPNEQLTPKQPKRLAFVPSQLGIKDVPKDHDKPPSLASQDIKHVTSISGSRVPARLKVAEVRRTNLMLKLTSEFPEYAKRLERGEHPHTMVESVDQPSIHIFVDMSNILIGFHELVKEIRGIPPDVRVRRIPFSFANFSLILERGRLSSKKVLAGSDRIPPIYEAELLGYEANILQRVPKPKAYSRAARNDSQEDHDGFSSSNSATENTGGQWVEQGVDEILHLKMLESLIDAEKPATIVLATGDAAKAEYSDGFLSMVERALGRGWNVELVSFRYLTSSAYKKKAFRNKWGAQFKIIDLDKYVEELLH